MTSAVAGGQLKSLIERVERLEEDKHTVTSDIREIYVEAKSHGFDIKIMRRVVRLRKQSRDARREEEAILDMYLTALGEK